MSTEKKALKFFNDHDSFGSWLVNALNEGFGSMDDGRCDIQTENPDDAKHARAITKEQYAEAMRDNLVKYLKSDEGFKEFSGVMYDMYDVLTEDREEDEEEDDDG